MNILALDGEEKGVVSADGVDFDGVNDYLSRSSDLVGNTDSKTFTFSCWVYNNGNTGSIWRWNNGQSSISITIYGISFSFRNSSGVDVLQGSAHYTLPKNTFSNIIFSVDLTNTSKRFIAYGTDFLAAVTWNTYNNDTLKFTSTTGGTVGLSFKGRLSNVFLDYTYRDLSIEANRRLFITADGKPTPTATLKALNPILYLPMKDAATCHINEGTGGNFTLNGTIATSERGANKDNCVASKLDGADYLTGGTFSNSKIATFNCSVKNVGDAPTFRAGRFTISLQPTYLNIQLRNTSDALILNANTSYGLTPFKMYNISISIDMDNQQKFVVFLNGKNITNDFVMSTFTTGSLIWIAQGASTVNSAGANCCYGELYFDTKYIDLATNNPFWDKDTNKPKTVRQVIKETGVTPLIAMPLDASNAGKNYGTGGDFTANSAPYVGARGASEYIARSAYFPALNGSNLTNSTPITGTMASIVIFYKSEIAAGRNILGFYDTGYVSVSQESAAAEVNIDGAFIMSFTPAATSTEWNYLFICGDGYNNTKNKVYDRTGQLSLSSNISQNKGFSFLNGTSVGGDAYSLYKGSVSSVYFTTDYIDFSQEVNRLKFVDAMNFPTDIGKKIEEGIIPKPLIYLPFSDPTNLGKNLGTGGDFTVNGTVTQGADVNG